MAIVLPDTFLTKICIVSEGSGDAQRELEGDECIVCCRGLDLMFDVQFSGFGGDCGVEGRVVVSCDVTRR